MNTKIEVGTTLWHPCSLDIIEHKVTCVKQYEGFTHYEAKAVRNVGACGRIEVILDEHKGKIRFVELVDEDEIEYSSGLQDFVEGIYYTDKRQAELEFYNNQVRITYSNVEQKKSWLQEAQKNHERVKLIVEKIKESLKDV